jgi:hypothetical protein
MWDCTVVYFVAAKKTTVKSDIQSLHHVTHTRCPYMFFFLFCASASSLAVSWIRRSMSFTRLVLPRRTYWVIRRFLALVCASTPAFIVRELSAASRYSYVPCCVVR